MKPKHIYIAAAAFAIVCVSACIGIIINNNLIEKNFEESFGEIRLGTTKTSAVHVLGEPDTKNDYVYLDGVKRMIFDIRPKKCFEYNIWERSDNIYIIGFNEKLIADIVMTIEK